MNLIFALAGAAVAAVPFILHQPTTGGVPKAARNDGRTIVEAAVDAGKFNTLVAAVKAAGLAETLSGKGPFTVFAPTDDAFAKLPKGTVEELLKPENKGKLTSILTYHVVSGSVKAAEALKLDFATTVEGGALRIESGKDGATVDGAKIVMTDIECTNGIIHVIDTVVMPRADIASVAKGAGMFNTLLAAAGAAGLDRALVSGGPFTVFAPTDEAFARLPKGTVETLLKPENKEKLVAVLKAHIVEGRVLAKNVTSIKSAKTLGGYEAKIEASAAGVMIAGSKVVKTDILAKNGVVHVIDTVIVP